jgi:hypothetical protein
MVNPGADSGPIFIGGLAHSGKTPLRLMLAAHPDLAMSRRTYMWTRFYNRYGDLSGRDNYERCLAAMLKQKGIRALRPDPDRIRREFWQGSPTYARLFALFHEHYAQQLGKSRWGDQLGFIERFVEPIFAAYPTARMVHMIRDPRDRSEVAMTKSRYRKGKVGWSTARWLYSAALAQENQDRYPDRYQVIRYEILVAEPEKTLRTICAFLGEDYRPRMLDAARFGKAEQSRRASLAGEPAVRSSKNMGHRLSERDLAFTQAYTRRHLLDFDYPLQPTMLSQAERLLFYFVDWPANRLGMAAWNTLKAKSLTRYLME